MSTGNQKFDKEFENAKKVLLKGCDKVMRGVAIEVFGEVIHQSPVDKGTFKGNWQCTLTKPAGGTLDTTDKGGDATVAKANSVIATFTIAKKSLLLTNNLPYAQRLADGWSKQRPSGWIDSIIAGFQAVVDKVAREEKLT